MSIAELRFQLRVYIAATVIFSGMAALGAVWGFFSAISLPFNISTSFLNITARSTTSAIMGTFTTFLLSLPLLASLNYLASRLSSDFLIPTRITAIWLAANLSGFYFSTMITLLTVTASEDGAEKFVFWGMLAALIPFVTGMKTILPIYRKLITAHNSLQD